MATVASRKGQVKSNLLIDFFLEHILFILLFGGLKNTTACQLLFLIIQVLAMLFGLKEMARVELRNNTLGANRKVLPGRLWWSAAVISSLSG